MTITEFLLARVAEDEAAARQAIEMRAAVDYVHQDEDDAPDMDVRAWEDSPIPALLVGPERMLAECEAKRRIVGYLADAVDEADGRHVISAYDDAVRALASVYADHPDFREEWRLL